MILKLKHTLSWILMKNTDEWLLAIKTFQMSEGFQCVLLLMVDVSNAVFSLTV